MNINNHSSFLSCRTCQHCNIYTCLFLSWTFSDFLTVTTYKYHSCLLLSVLSLRYKSHAILSQPRGVKGVPLNKIVPYFFKRCCLKNIQSLMCPAVSVYDSSQIDIVRALGSQDCVIDLVFNFTIQFTSLQTKEYMFNGMPCPDDVPCVWLCMCVCVFFLYKERAVPSTKTIGSFAKVPDSSLFTGHVFLLVPWRRAGPRCLTPLPVLGLRCQLSCSFFGVKGIIPPCSKLSFIPKLSVKRFSTFHWSCQSLFPQ